MKTLLIVYHSQTGNTAQLAQAAYQGACQVAETHTRLVRASVEQALMSAVPGLRATIQLLPNDVEAHFDDAEDLI